MKHYHWAVKLKGIYLSGELKNERQLRLGELLLRVQDKKVVNLDYSSVDRQEDQGKGITLEILKLVKKNLPYGWEIHINAVQHQQTLYKLLEQIFTGGYRNASPTAVKVWEMSEGELAV